MKPMFCVVKYLMQTRIWMSFCSHLSHHMSQQSGDIIIIIIIHGVTLKIRLTPSLCLIVDSLH